MNRKRLIYILLGPALLGLCTVATERHIRYHRCGSDRCRTLDDILVDYSSGSYHCYRNRSADYKCIFKYDSDGERAVKLFK